MSVPLQLAARRPAHQTDGGRRRPLRTLLVSMPWESASRPSLALGTLTALAERAGFSCTSRYLNLDLAATLGGDEYERFAEDLELFPLGEHLFAVDLFGSDVLESETYLEGWGPQLAEHGLTAARVRQLRDVVVPDFLTGAVERVAAQGPDVVGLTCTFNQVLPSLALAHRLKRARPGVTVLLGGACVHGAMGVAYARAFGDCIDHVFTGEADDSFLEWLDLAELGQETTAVWGVVAAGPSASAAHAPARPTWTLDDLPVPQYEPFFEQRGLLDAGPGRLPPVRHLPYESSRGCWWGEKHHCTFCGLNNEGMTYRRKSPDRVVRELATLARAHGLTSFMAADNILDFRSYQDLLARLAADPVDYHLFYEIKANLRRDDVAALRRAHVLRVQPGIESFSDHVLALMRKGITSLGNVQALKWLHEFGVAVDYNILVGFPGETAADYQSALALMRRLWHLPAPGSGPTIARVDRFSPFFEEPEALGIRDVRPAAHYRHLIPVDRLAAGDYAYFFDRDLTDLQAVGDEVVAMDAVIAGWRASTARRRARLGPGFVEVLTQVHGTVDREVLRGTRAALFVLCDAHRSVARLRTQLAATDGASFDTDLAALVDAGIVLVDETHAVTAIPFAEPHLEADLRHWLAAYVPELAVPALDPAAGPTRNVRAAPARGE